MVAPPLNDTDELVMLRCCTAGAGKSTEICLNATFLKVFLVRMASWERYVGERLTKSVYKVVPF